VAMSKPSGGYRVKIGRSAVRDLSSGKLPDGVAAAVISFIESTLRYNPHRVGKPLREPLEGLWSARREEYRVLYAIDTSTMTLVVVAVVHRSDAYRPRHY